MKRRGLGRGLETLLPDPRPTGIGSGVRELPLDRLEPNPDQPRAEIPPADLESLAASIAAWGILEPIVVRPHPRQAGRFQIIAGERRWRAARLAGLERAPVVLRETPDRELAILALVENLQREDLNPVEEARAFRQLQQEAGLTHEQIATQVGLSRSAVTNSLRLLDLGPTALRLVENGGLRAAAARALVPLDREQQDALAAEVVSRGLPVREVERRARVALGSRRKAGGRPSRSAKDGPDAELDANTRDAQERMQRAMGLPVAIRRHGLGGSVRIRFFSEDDLHRVFARLTESAATEE